MSYRKLKKQSLHGILCSYLWAVNAYQESPNQLHDSLPVPYQTIHPPTCRLTPLSLAPPSPLYPHLLPYSIMQIGCVAGWHYAQTDIQLLHRAAL